MANTNPSTTPTTVEPAAALWRIVVSEFEQASVQFDANWAAFEAADEAANKECPLRYEFHDYGLHTYMTRKDALLAVDVVIAMRDKKAGVDVTDAVADQQAQEAERIVDEFFAYTKAREASLERNRVGELRKAHSEFCNGAFYAARDKLLETPAPDIAAVLLKAEILANAVDEAEGLKADLDRLLKVA